MGFVDWFCRIKADFEIGSIFPKEALLAERQCLAFLGPSISGPKKLPRDHTTSLILANRYVVGYITGFVLATSNHHHLLSNTSSSERVRLFYWMTQRLFSKRSNLDFWQFAGQLIEDKNDEFTKGIELAEEDYTNLLESKGIFPLLFPLIANKSEPQTKEFLREVNRLT